MSEQTLASAVDYSLDISHVTGGFLHMSLSKAADNTVTLIFSWSKGPEVDAPVDQEITLTAHETQLLRGLLNSPIAQTLLES
ncbi:hypothetical protein [Ktedonobacter racemifer]|uniref:Uncharacterized protein n=1 Tax=Ktedonobacter racemifer DSM 44963 TaxID=485913 RepID=D6TLE3_KTERA|nr:hypothetical protein [Ktedonobacter racemifer]EFH86593.1 hypothetical protein Krac_7896 [Ktedonobacter racemifer DSM 44963]